MTQITNIIASPLGAIAVVPIIIALVQVYKMVGMPTKFAPLASMGTGVVIGFLLNHAFASLTHNILEGILYGLSASGLYSGIQTTGNIDLTKNEK